MMFSNSDLRARLADGAILVLPVPAVVHPVTHCIRKYAETNTGKSQVSATILFPVIHA